MRWNGALLSIATAALMSTPSPCVAATFGTVVPIGGHASDIALDESRGLLYIANFTANRIEVMSTADYSIHTSMNVIDTFANLGKQLPVDPNTFPSQVILAALSTNSARSVVYGIADNGSAQAFYRFDLRTGLINAVGITAVPKPLPRVSVADDGS